MRGILLLFLLIFASCSEDETIDRLSLLSLAKQTDSSFSVVLAEKIGAGPTCSGDSPSLAYGAGCKKVFRVKVKELEFAVIEFESTELAIKEAKRLRQYCFKNWVFDEVRTEPPLEQFMKDAFGLETHL